MKHKYFIIGMILFLSVVHTNGQEKCPDVIVVRRGLYDSLQDLKNGSEIAERDITRYRKIRDDLRRKYNACEKQSDVEAMLNQADENLRSVEKNGKILDDAYSKVEKTISQIIRDAHGTPVEVRFFQDGFGNFGRVTTVKFTLDGDKVVTNLAYYELPDHIAP